MSTGTNTDAPLMLSVSGCRGIVGRSMTDVVAARFALAFATELTGGRLRLCLGRDSRPSGEDLSRAVAEAIAAGGHEVIDLGIVTTPTIGVMVDHLGIDGGIVLTASHNPTPWNGVKCLIPPGVAPPAPLAQRVIDRFRAGEQVARDVGPGRLTKNDEANAVHLERALAQVDVLAVRDRGFKVALDSINGAGCAIGRMLLEALGCDVVQLNGKPNGLFAHTPEPTEANLTDLARQTRENKCVVGFAQDPDGDRLAIVDETGRYIGEEYTLVLCAKQMLDVHSGGAIAANLSTSRMIDDLAARYEGGRIVRTAVGEANVAEAMQREHALCGGEGNGGFIVPQVCYVRDSITSMALVLSLMASGQRPLSAIVDALPRYAMIKQKYDVSAIGGREAIPAILLRARGALSGAAVDEIDGVRLDVEEGWVHVRASNTEPIVRLIAEARSDEEASRLARDVARVVGLS